jgi:Ran GTPase-activating protein (RanGAP) involved in mRNA processing and transport
MGEANLSFRNPKKERDRKHFEKTLPSHHITSHQLQNGTGMSLENHQSDMQQMADALRAKTVANTRAVVNEMFTEDEVTVDVYRKVDMQLVGEVLMTKNVRVKKLKFDADLSIEDAETLRDALQDNTSVEELDLLCATADSFAAVAQGMAVQQTVKKLSLDGDWGMEMHLSSEEDLMTFHTGLRSIMPFIQEFSLRKCYIRDAGARVLAETMIESGSSLRELKLNGCYIGRIGAAHLGEALQANTSLEVLKLLDDNRIGNDGVIALAEGLMHSQSIRVLHLEFCGLTGSEGVAYIARLLDANATLQELTLSNNCIGNDGAIALAEGLMHSQSIRVLNLMNCGIGTNGAAAVGRLLEANATIEELDISHNYFDNYFDEAGCSALADGLSHNQGLRNLNLQNCSVHSEGAKRIGLTLKSNSHLERLNLLRNSITKEGFEALAEGLSCNTTLLHLGLDRYDRWLLAVPSSINVCLAANRMLHGLRSQEPGSIRPFLLPLILARVSSHPAALDIFLREHFPDLLA